MKNFKLILTMVLVLFLDSCGTDTSQQSSNQAQKYYIFGGELNAENLIHEFSNYSYNGDYDSLGVLYPTINVNGNVLLGYGEQDRPIDYWNREQGSYLDPLIKNYCFKNTVFVWIQGENDIYSAYGGGLLVDNQTGCWFSAQGFYGDFDRFSLSYFQKIKTVCPSLTIEIVTINYNPKNISSNEKVIIDNQKSFGYKTFDMSNYQTNDYKTLTVQGYQNLLNDILNN